MIHRELSATLAAVIEGLEPPPGSGLIVTQAELDLPLEVYGARRGNELVFLGDVPHSRWKSGVLPPVHMSHLTVELVPSTRSPEHIDA
jgi:hypothetical protein